MNRPTSLIFEAICSSFFKERIAEINYCLYNRKQEAQIRDLILFYITKNAPYDALSEFPKVGKGAVDLSIFEGIQTLATVEFKFQYPRDCLKQGVIEAFIKDINRAVDTQTTHFVLIIQEREQKGSLRCDLKYMDLNQKYHKTLLNKFESHIGFRKNHNKYVEHIKVDGLIDSVYTFIVYEFN